MILYTHDTYRLRAPSEPSEQVQNRAAGFQAIQEEEVSEFAVAAAWLHAVVAKRQYRLSAGSPVSRWNRTDVLAILGEWAGAGEATPGEWQRVALELAADNEEYS